MDREGSSRPGNVFALTGVVRRNISSGDSGTTNSCVDDIDEGWVTIFDSDTRRESPDLFDRIVFSDLLERRDIRLFFLVVTDGELKLKTDEAPFSYGGEVGETVRHMKKSMEQRT